MATMKKATEPKVTYDVIRDPDFISGDPTYGRYIIDKMNNGIRADQYRVEVRMPMRDEHDVKCNCPGFARQSYDKREHKHVKMVRRYIAEGSPQKVTMTINSAREVSVLVVE